jgi:peptide/nickel transport system substrate-binding protein
MGMASALLAACGGDDNNGSGGAGSDGSGGSSLIKEPVDTSKSAVRGGTLSLSSNFDIGSFDPTLSVPQLNEPFGNAMGKLFAMKPGHLEPPNGDMEGEVAEAIEYSPDGLTATIKLHPNMSWHPIAPVNGRAVDADDIKFSWKLFSEKSTYRNLVVNSVSPLAPVTSSQVTDDRTLVLKLAFPTQLEPLFAFAVSGGLWMVPKEGDGGYDLRNKMIGLGPFYLAEYVPSSKFTYKRFDKYWDIKNRPYLDGTDQVILPEAATRLAQFQAGNIYFTNGGGSIPTQDDVMTTLSATPKLEVYQDDYQDGFTFIMFGWSEGNAWRDERVRQAFSMSIDRDTFLRVRGNADKFEAAGIPFDTRWHTAVAAGAYEGYWLDPRGKDFGENAKYFAHNIEEAKKLLSAAGHANGVQATANIAGNNAYGAAGTDQEIMSGMAAEAGFHFTMNERNFQTDYIPNVRDAGGKFEGWTLRGSATGLMADIMARLIAEFHSKGSIFETIGFDAKGVGDASGDPKLDADLEKALKERDLNKKKALIWDIQRYIAKTQYTGRHPGTARPLRMNWPALQNVNVFRGAHQQQNHRFWLDQTLPPIKNA